MTTTRIYRWDDPGAPVLNGLAGSLYDLLKACLVGDGSGIAYGSGANEKQAAGWTALFDDGANDKIALQNDISAGGSGSVVRIDDGAPGAGGGREARLRVYSAMSDVDTGSDPTPNTSQSTPGIVILKSTTADSTARPWWLFADERTFYIAIQASKTAASATGSVSDNLYWFGDFDSFLPGDAYAFGCGGRIQENTTSAINTMLAANTTATANNVATVWVCKSTSGVGDPVRVSMLSLFDKTQIVGSAGYGISNPDPLTSNEYWYPALVVHDNSIRGVFRGLLLSANLISGVTAGAVRSAPTARPIGSEITIVRNSNVATYGGAGIESGIGW